MSPVSLSRVLLTTSVATLVGVGLPSLASAEPDPGDAKVELLESMGRRAFREHRYPDAIDAFQAAYLMKPDARFLYNLGRSHEKAGDLARSIEYLTEYLTQEIGAKDRADAEAVLAVVRVRWGRANANEALPLPERDPKPPPVEAPDLMVDDGPEPRSVDRTPESGPAPYKYTGDPLGVGWPSVIAFGAGAALLAGGVTFGVLSSGAQRRRDDLKGAGPVPAARFVEEDSAAHTRALVSNVLLGAGAAAVAAGLVSALLDGDDADVDGAGPVSAVLVSPSVVRVVVCWGGAGR